MSGLRIVEKPEGVELVQNGQTIELRVPDRGLVDGPVSMELGEGVARLIVRAGVSSRMRLALSFGGHADKAETLSVELSFELESGACVDVFYLSPGHKPLDTILAKAVYHLKKHSSLNLWTFSGDSLATIRHDVIFVEEHAFASMNGLSLLADSSQVTHELHAQHNAGHCISRQYYKSIVSDQARTSFDSQVTVAEGAAKSDSKQLNKNLILSKQARALSRPELKISADDVSCNHGSATGQMDPAQLFYLRSRGIDEKTARFMMIEGFAGEIYEGLPDLPLKKDIRAWMKTRIGAMMTPAALTGVLS